VQSIARAELRPYRLLLSLKITKSVAIRGCYRGVSILDPLNQALPPGELVEAF
jgi:hypothetical protein